MIRNQFPNLQMKSYLFKSSLTQRNRIRGKRQLISVYSFGKCERTEVRAERVLQEAFNTKIYSANRAAS